MNNKIIETLTDIDPATLTAYQVELLGTTLTIWIMLFIVIVRMVIKGL